MPPPGLQILLRPRLTLTFDLLTLKVDHFMPVPHRPLVPIGVKIGFIVFKISRVHTFGNRRYRTDRRTNRQTDDNMMPPPVTLAWRTREN